MDQSEINIVESQNKNDEKLKLYKNLGFRMPSYSSLNGKS